MAMSAVQPECGPDPYPLSRPLLMMILEDRLSDRFVCELIWRRLGYAPDGPLLWQAGPTTPAAWAEAFPRAPQLIAERPASVRLTRSIPAEHKQLLKSQLGFAGYRIGELVPRRTRRATAVSWLLADLAARGEDLPEQGPLPEPLAPPASPDLGHPGDPAVQ
ncbi:DUF1823 family protein [Synechococcus sp. CS-205]|uniref:DUF1823 family protein n=1 Tax=Synechococcus sp. CS-205 TaxID=2847984 RepID=UPI00223BAD23|nr:DUF1823 family protein [Synechococcus sp. CS-205]